MLNLFSKTSIAALFTLNCICCHGESNTVTINGKIFEYAKLKHVGKRFSNVYVNDQRFILLPHEDQISPHSEVYFVIERSDQECIPEPDTSETAPKVSAPYNITIYYVRGIHEDKEIVYMEADLKNDHLVAISKWTMPLTGRGKYMVLPDEKSIMLFDLKIVAEALNTINTSSIRQFLTEEDNDKFEILFSKIKNCVASDSKIEK